MKEVIMFIYGFVFGALFGVVLMRINCEKHSRRPAPRVE
jgi:hypothetical protein